MSLEFIDTIPSGTAFNHYAIPPSGVMRGFSDSSGATLTYQLWATNTFIRAIQLSGIEYELIDEFRDRIVTDELGRELQLVRIRKNDSGVWGIEISGLPITRTLNNYSYETLISGSLVAKYEVNINPGSGAQWINLIPCDDIYDTTVTGIMLVDWATITGTGEFKFRDAYFFEHEPERDIIGEEITEGIDLKISEHLTHTVGEPEFINANKKSFNYPRYLYNNYYSDDFINDSIVEPPFVNLQWKDILTSGIKNPSSVWRAEIQLSGDGVALTGNDIPANFFQSISISGLDDSKNYYINSIKRNYGASWEIAVSTSGIGEVLKYQNSSEEIGKLEFTPIISNISGFVFVDWDRFSVGRGVYDEGGGKIEFIGEQIGITTKHNYLDYPKPNHQYRYIIQNYME